MFTRRNWDSPNPSLASECAPPLGTKGGAHSPAGEGFGGGGVPIPTTEYVILEDFNFTQGRLYPR
jgi:hypothetical protein